MEDEESRTNPRNIALKSLGISEEVANNSIATIEEWIEENDFPEKMSKIMIEMFLIRNKFRVEVTKKKISMYYKMRKEIPAFFEGKHPQQSNMKDAMKTSYFVFSPKLTPEFHTVNFFQFIDENPKNFIADDFCGLAINVSELKLINNVYSLGDIYVCDLKGSSLAHSYYFGVNNLRKLAKVTQEVFPTSVKAIHFVNSPGYMKTLLALIKAVLNPKIVSRIQIHEKPEDVAKFISKECLPVEFGGQGESLNELRGFLTHQFTKFEDRFNELERINRIMNAK